MTLLKFQDLQSGMEKKRSIDEVISRAGSQDAKRPSRIAFRQRQRNTGKLWLDIPPSEIRVRIARMICFGRPNPAALHLAQTNAIQQEAVLDALSCKLEISGDAIPDLGRWIYVFADTIREISVGHICVFRSERSSVLELLKAPTLRRAHIFDDTDVLNAVAESKSIQELVVRICTTHTQHLLLRTLKSLSLTKLELYSYSRFARECPFNALTNEPSDVGTLLECCPKVASLKMSCSLSHHTHHHQNDPVWKLIPLFPTLREVTVETDAPEDVLPSLKKLESVHVTSRLLWAVDKPDAASVNAFRMAMNLGSVVTHLTTQEVLSAGQVSQLVECPNLTHLEIRIQEGEDQTMAKCVASLPSLRSLKLRWLLRTPASIMSRELPSEFSASTPGVVSDIAKNASNLTELELVDVKIELDELDEMLRCFGRRLTHFGISIIGQHETPCSRLLGFMRCVTKHSTGLHSWNVDISSLPTAYPLSAWGDGSLRHHKRPLRAALDRLKRSVPLLDICGFERQFIGIFGSVESPHVQS